MPDRMDLVNYLTQNPACQRHTLPSLKQTGSCSGSSKLEDLPELWEFHRNPENIRHYHDAPPTLEEVTEQLEWDLDWYQKNEDLGTWAIVHKATGKLAGLCSLMPWTVDGVEEVEMAYVLAEECRGQGLGPSCPAASFNMALRS